MCGPAVVGKELPELHGSGAIFKPSGATSRRAALLVEGYPWINLGTYGGRF